MKKRMIAALAGLMVLALGSVTVLAAPSTETETQKQSVTQDAAAVKGVEQDSVQIQDESGNSVNVSVTVSDSGSDAVVDNGQPMIVISQVETLDAEEAVDTELAGLNAFQIIELAEEKAQAEANVATLLTNLGERQKQRAVKLAAFSITTKNFSDEQKAALKAGTANISLTFNVDGVVEGRTYLVMHYCTADKKWETMEPVVGNGTLTLTFHSFSPVIVTEVIAVDDENLGEGAGEGNGSTLTAGVTSPKTGETVPFAAVLSVALFAGAAVCAAKRVKFN